MVKGIPVSIKIFAVAYVAAIILFVIGPLVVVAGVSFTAGDYITFPPQGTSLRWYEAIVTSPVYLDAAWTSLKLAVLVTISATVIGAAMAIVIHRQRLPGTTFIAGIFLAPLVLPTIVFALGLLIAWSSYWGATSLLTLWIGHTVIAIPYVIRTTLAVLATSDKFLEEAGRTLGAGPWKAIFYVVLPQAMQGIAAGAFFAFNISFDEAILSLFLRSPEIMTLPIQIYTQLEFSPDPSIAAASTLMILLTVIMILIIDRLFGIQRVAG
ncbi:MULTISPECIES: ABC transporter permease [Rhizobiaceae]|jgi:putative spermidine/putrescine transport system permease protein|uniref:ABC transporter permease n=1 Tax=Shinella sumterensis TaxID=1967501 RepID=A0AA50H7U5_9HYPH|nr:MULTISPECIES: ABC transporter permease [Rhizobiaceae]KRA60518.1 ABC transporter permease [Rhizobium sp. Root651]WLS01415.1 ABC transporter permease [Shinella sumterensis]